MTIRLVFNEFQEYAFWRYLNIVIRFLTAPCIMACSYCPDVTAASGLVVYVVIDAISLIGSCERETDQIET